MISIQKITSESPELETAKILFREYGDELNEDLCFQSFDAELENPLIKYGPPKGALFIANWNGEVAGCIALQPLSEAGVCEMKRLYVRPGFRKFGIGDELIKQLLETAKEIGYTKMVLDTLERLQAATRLYQRHGFINTSAYYPNPLPEVVYMERQLIG